MKTCGKCKAEKPKTEFSKHCRNPDGLQRYCKDCRRLHRAATAKQISDYQKAYRAAYPGKRNEQQKRYAANNPEKIAAYKALFSEKIAKSARAYRKSNPDKVAAHKRNRRAINKNAEGKHTAADVRRIFEHQRGICANCKIKLIKSGKNKYHIDHIVALARGGSNWPSNLQCLCPPCNVKKSAKDPIDWARENGRLI